MRILLISTYFEPDSGAAAVRLSRLAKRLQKRGHEVHVLTALPHYPQGRIAEGYRRRFSVTEERDGLCITRSWLWATPSPRISRKLVSQVSFMATVALQGLRLARPDVALIEAQPIFTSVAGAFVCRVKRVPYILNVSDLWPDHLLSVGAMTERHPVYRLARRLMDNIYRGAAGIVALSDALGDGIKAHIGPDEKVKVIYNAVDLERFRPGLDAAAFRQKYNLGDARLVSFIGTFATQYDMGAMLEVARRLAKRRDVCFAFIGGGSQSETLRKLLAQDELPNVRWLGWLDYGDIPLAWAASHLTYWALRDHDFYRGTNPAKSYEAMACGVPIAAAMEGLGADIIRRSGAGLTVPFGDVEGLVRAIERLLDDTDLHQQCSRAGRAYAEVHFDPERVAAAYEDVLRLAVERAGV